MDLEPYLLSIDCGTQSLRVIVFDVSGTVIVKEKISYAPYFSEKPGWAEQYTETWWNALVMGCQKIKKEHPKIMTNVCGIGVTAQRDTIIIVDDNGAVLRPAITWLDTRAAEGSFNPKGLKKFVYETAGMYSKLMHMKTTGQCNWIQENEPGLWKKTWKVLMVSGYINYKLTGNPCDAAASIVGHIPFDYKRRRWAGRHSVTAQLFPVPEEKLCNVVESGEIIGKVTSVAATETGLPEGVSVVACGSDKSCESIGMGSIKTSMASLSFGTTATVAVCTPHYIEPVPFMPAYCAAIPGCWVPEIEIFRGYWMISWFKNELGYEERAKATSTGILPEKLLDRTLDATPPGCYGLMLQPYWGASLKDDYAKGSMIGFGDIHGRFAIYRAIIEGLAYSLRDGLEQLEKRGRFQVDSVAVSGGASQSDRVCQTTADILNKPLVRGKTTETSALGAAVITAKGIGLYRTVTESVANIVKYEKIFEPQAETRKIYDGLYGVYKNIYPELKKSYREIQKITNYPEL